MCEGTIIGAVASALAAAEARRRNCRRVGEDLRDVFVTGGLSRGFGWKLAAHNGWSLKDRRAKSSVRFTGRRPPSFRAFVNHAILHHKTNLVNGLNIRSR